MVDVQRMMAILQDHSWREISEKKLSLIVKNFRIINVIISL